MQFLTNLSLILADTAVLNLTGKIDPDLLTHIKDKVQHQDAEDGKILLGNGNNKFSVESEETIPKSIELMHSYKIINEKMKEAIKSNSFDTLDKNFIVLFTDKAKHFQKIEEEIEVFVSSDEKLAAESKIPFPGYLGYNSAEKNSFKFSLNTKDSEIQLTEAANFVQAPILSQVGPHNIKNYENKNFPTFYMFSSADDMNKNRQRFLPSSLKYKNKLRVAFVEFSKESTKHKEIVGENQLPVTVLFHNNMQYKLEGTTTPENLEKFFDQHFEGVIKPVVMEEKPHDNTGKNVKIAVRSNAEEMLKNKDKDVLVMFHAYWCHYCNITAPILDQLGEFTSKHASKIDVVKIDLEKNTLNEYKVPHYPFFRIYKAGTNEVVDYSGNRSLESFKEFIKINGTHKIDLDVVEESENQKIEGDKNANEVVEDKKVAEDKNTQEVEKDL